MQKNALHKLTVIILITLLLTTTLSIGQQTPTTRRLIHYVGGTGPYNHSTIQAAIDFAAAGDTIYVYSGYYNENLTVDKTLNINGENPLDTIIHETGNTHTISILSDYVTIMNFTIRGGNKTGFTAGININANNATISHNIIKDNSDGIRLINVNNHVISYNIIRNNSDEGILLDNTQLITLEANTFLCNGVTSAGIWIENSKYISAIQNNLSYNNHGIYLHDTTNSSIHTNIFSANTNGIYITSSTTINNLIVFNNFINNSQNAYDPNTNLWNNSLCPRIGNYWDDYTGIDADDNGIGDTPYPIPGGTNHDHYPLINTYGTPIAHFTYTPTGLTVDFNAATTIDHDGSITNYTWNFGDTTIGYGITPTHTYPQTDTYTVILTVTDNDGLTDTYTHTFLLNDPPYTPSNPHPPNNTTGHCNILLNWTGGDPNPTNTVTYDLYLGTTTPPPLLLQNLTTTTYDPGILLDCTSYYWQIIAWDNHGAMTTGPLWTFRTNCPPNTPTDPYPEHQATEVPINTILSWTSTDPDTGQPLTYDIYLDTTSPPLQIIANHTETTYTPDTLEFDTTYYWQIITWDTCNESATSPIWEFTTAPYYRIPDLDCIGSLSWTKVPPGSTQTGAFTILNIGEAHSQLNWEIASTPTWGTWNITPNQGLGLTPQAGPLIITVKVIAPDVPQSDFTGNIKVINTDDPSDYELIPITLTTPTPTPYRPLLTLLTQLLNQFPLLQTLLSTLLSLFA